MSVRTDKVNLVINVNNNQAQNALNEQRKKYSDLTNELSKLKKGTDEWVKKNEEIKKVKSEMDTLKKSIGITALTQKELVSEISKLKSIRGSVAPLSDEFKQLSRQIKEAESRYNELKNGTESFGSVFSKTSNQVKQFGMIAAGYLGFEFLSSEFKNILANGGKLSDQLADLQRVAGFTASEAKNLNSQLSALDTRTSTSGLREIAIIAGKLGVAKKDIFDFTKAVDMMVVSLGDELGSAQDITDKLGKILNVFDGNVNGDNISRLGNAFVELANSGVASGGFIADFDQRLSGIAKSAGIGLGELSGLGAGLEELGARSESSSTAIQKLIITISEDIPKAAKIAGMDVKDFNALFAKDPTEALLRYSEGLVKNKQSFAEVTAAFKDAGEEGARTIQTISQLGTSSDLLRSRILLGKQAMTETTAITEAFAIKNETLGAVLDKIGKNVSNLFVNSAFADWLKSVASGFNELISPAKTAAQEFDDLSKKVNNLDKNIIPLANRYDELKSKTNLSKTEQAEMQRIIDTISKTIPSAVTQFDQYGNAIAISTNRVREFIAAEKARLSVVNAKAIEEYAGKLKEVERDITLYKSKIDQIAATGSFLVAETQASGTGSGSVSLRKAGQDEIAAVQETYRQLVQKRLGYNQEISRLNGDSLQQRADQQQADAKAAQAAEEQRQKQEAAARAAANMNTQTEEQKKEAERRKKEYDRIKEDADKFYEDLQKIKSKAVRGGEDPQQADIDALLEKYADLIKRAADFNKELRLLGKGNNDQYSKEQALLEESLQKELLNISKKYGQLKERDEQQRVDQNYRAAIASQRNQSEQLVLIAKQQYAEGTIDKEQYEKRLRELSVSALEDQISTAGKWADKSKQAAKDVAEYKRQLEALVTENAITEAEARVKLAEYEKEQQTKAADERRQLIADATNEILNYAQQVSNIFTALANLQNNREQAEFNREKRANDARKKGYEDQLKARLISKEQYDRKIAQSDEALDRKDKELKRRQAEREKGLNLFQAIINTASAVAEALPNIPLSILAGVLGGIQIASIQSQELPELGTGDWIRTGAKHSDISGGINAKIERDEAVIKAAAMTDPSVVTVTGNTAQITSALNARAGGKSWAPGAVIEMAEWRKAAPASFNPNLSRIMEQGGVVRPINPSSSISVSNELLANIYQEMQSNTREIATMKREIHAVVSIKQIKSTEDLYNAAKAASGL